MILNELTIKKGKLTASPFLANSKIILQMRTNIFLVPMPKLSQSLCRTPKKEVSGLESEVKWLYGEFNPIQHHQ